uniref:Uncharacterized protein n=1 Tax=Aegilops tauschii subsp. strangulata TaxID=200361 RepID=A0A453PHI9_AEGTS
NTATGYLLVFSLMAGVVGACSVLPALLHVRAPWHSESLAAAASTGLVSWALTALAFGLACKHITLGNRGRRLVRRQPMLVLHAPVHLSLYITAFPLGGSSYELCARLASRGRWRRSSRSRR